jgi:hypothetical protein
MLAFSTCSLPAMQEKCEKIKTMMSDNVSQTCLLTTVLLEYGIPRTQSTEEIILCSQKPTIIKDYVRINEPIEKGWKGYKMIGYEFTPMQSSQRLTDSDEATPLYEPEEESIYIDLNPTKTSLRN